MRSVFLVLVLGACAGGMDAGGAADEAPGGGGVSFGGAQDIGEFRSILERGDIPDPDSLDANGFFNEHFNAAPPAACGNTLCLTPGLSVGRDWLTGKHQATLQIAVHTPVDPSTYERLPMNLVVVVDRSGSMQEDNRLEKVKVGLHTLVDNLRDEDRVSLISFDHAVRTDVQLRSELDRPRLHAAIDELTPGGSTNIYDALQAGFEMIGVEPGNERQHRIIFLSDGMATAGITDRSSIIEMSRGAISRGIGLTTIGVGNSFDVELMRGLAESGAGNYYFLEDGAAAGEVFTEELDYFMSPLALDVRIEASAGAGWTFDEVVGSRLWSAQQKKGSMAIPAVFLASRESQEPGNGRRGGGSMIFVRLEPTGDATSKVATLTLSYRMPGSSERVTETVTLDYANDPRETPADPHLSSAEMAERYAMYNLFIGLRYATKTYGGCAMSALQATRRYAADWNERHPDPDITADLVLVDQYIANLRAHGTLEGSELASCPKADEPYWPQYDDDYAYDDHGHAHCSAGGGTAGWLVLVGAIGFVVRRRRR